MVTQLQLPLELAMVYPVLHISLLKKCVGDPTSIVQVQSECEQYSHINEEVSVEILDHQVCRLRNKEVSSVNDLWRSQSVTPWIKK